MNRENYKPRIIDNKIKRYLGIFGAILIEGPKWCGKTWSGAYHSKSALYLADPSGNFQNRELAQLSPALVLEGEYPRLIDEWQEVPGLWDGVRFKVDEAGSKGMFILTESATPPREGYLHSGAGRIARLKMRPMSLYESGDSSGKISLFDVCHGKLESMVTEEVDLQVLIDLIIRGGWPQAIGMSALDATAITSSYIEQVLAKDISYLDGHRRNPEKMRRLMKSLARNESTTVSSRKIRADMGEYGGEEIDAKTMDDYLDVLDKLYLLDNQPPFDISLRSSIRAKQAVKRHFVDPSISVSLLGATRKSLLRDLETLGFLFEALCERDLRIYCESFDARLFHYQDYKNREIDAVIELNDGRWCALEIKLGAHQIDSAAKSLIKLRDEIKKQNPEKAPDVLCIICGLTRAAYQREDGVFVVPITALKA